MDRLQALSLLVQSVQELSLARSLDEITVIVRRAARLLTGADGASFVLREEEHCYYLDEDAIAPLWKGQRFPLDQCISGWVMQHRRAAIIEDIYADERVPQDAYRPTFVKSLVLVPIRCVEPVGAIGSYWAKKHRPTTEEVEALQALANSTSVALENLHLVANLERIVAQRTEQLEMANRDLEAFNYSVSHDLRAPLRAIVGFSELLAREGSDSLNQQCRDYLDRTLSAARRMDGMITAMLNLGRLGRDLLHHKCVNLSHLARDICLELQRDEPHRQVEFSCAGDMKVIGDENLLRLALANLVGNAWKFTRKSNPARIEIGAQASALPDRQVIYIRDNGVGFDPSYADKLFQPFQRLHSAGDFEGYGIGLSIVKRIVQRHEGRVWADSAVDQGAVFYLDLPLAGD